MVLDNNKLEEVWAKAIVVTGYDPSSWRKDFAGAWIQHDQYGLPTEFGWDIFQIVPASKGGADDVENLYPINRKNNICKADAYPIFKTVVTSDGEKNIIKEQVWQIVQ